jgi:mutator protein MutT
MAKFFKVNVSVVIFNGDKILIQKRSMDEDVFPGLWGIPGGTVEMTDQSLESALEREVMEEVGIKIGNLQIIQNNIKEKEMYGMIYIVYTADYGSGEPKAMEGTEQVSWMNHEDIDKLEFTPKTVDVIKMAYESH